MLFRSRARTAPERRRRRESPSAPGVHTGAIVKQPQTIQKPEGKLGVLLPGLGAVATTTIAGVMLARRGLSQPVGSLTQLGTIRLGKRTDNRSPLIKDFVPLPDLDQLEFGGWDIFPDDACEAARHAAVLEGHHIDAVREELSAVRPMKGVFYPEYVKRLHGTQIGRAHV